MITTTHKDHTELYYHNLQDSFEIQSTILHVDTVTACLLCKYTANAMTDSGVC